MNSRIGCGQTYQCLPLACDQRDIVDGVAGPACFISVTDDPMNPNRQLTRPAWKRLHRQMRITCRESTKALFDARLYGKGVTRVTADGIWHVPYHEVEKGLSEAESERVLVELGLTND